VLIHLFLTVLYRFLVLSKMPLALWICLLFELKFLQMYIQHDVSYGLVDRVIPSAYEMDPSLATPPTIARQLFKQPLSLLELESCPNFLVLMACSLEFSLAVFPRLDYGQMTHILLLEFCHAYYLRDRTIKFLQ
jgi:hypothetical protein